MDDFYYDGCFRGGVGSFKGLGVVVVVDDDGFFILFNVIDVVVDILDSLFFDFILFIFEVDNGWWKVVGLLFVDGRDIVGLVIGNMLFMFFEMLKENLGIVLVKGKIGDFDEIFGLVNFDMKFVFFIVLVGS